MGRVCTRCGATAADDAAVCENCGQSLSPLGDALSGAVLPPPKPKYGLPLRILALLLTLAVLPLTAMAMFRDLDFENTYEQNLHTDPVAYYIGMRYLGDPTDLERMVPPCFWEYAEEELDSTQEALCDELEESQETLLENAEALYGSNYTVTWRVTRETRLDGNTVHAIAKALDQRYGVDWQTVTAGYALRLQIHQSGSQDNNYLTADMTVVKIDGTWYLVHTQTDEAGTLDARFILG